MLLFCSFVSYSQTSFSDTLESVTNLTREYLILRPDNTYWFESYACTFADSVTGTYTVKNNLLILKDTVNHIIRDTQKSEYQVKDIYCGSNSLANIDFKILDENNQNVSDGTILINNIGRGAYIKKDGTCSLKNLKIYQDVVAVIKVYGYKTLKIKINLNTCKYVNVIMKSKNEITFSKFDKNSNGLIAKFAIKKVCDYENDRELTSKNSSLILTPLYDDLDE